jgi:hypothetical protein
MKLGKIYTLEWIKDQARNISSSWNGQDDTFQYEDEIRPAEDAEAALELLDKVREVEALIEELGI